MTDDALSSKDLALWQAFKQANNAYRDARSRVFHNAEDLMAIVKYGLTHDRGDIGLALSVAQMLTPEQRAPFLPKFLIGATYQNPYVITYRGLVLSMPREWLKENIERYISLALQEDDDTDTYANLIELCKSIDKAIAIRLSEQALNHADAAVRQVGSEALAELTEDD
jgi:hypothetical protein